MKFSVKVNKEKTRLFRSSVNYVGYSVTHDKITMDAKGVLEYKTPTTKTEVRSFVSFASYFRNFVPDLARMCRPLHAVQGTNAEWVWGQEQQEAFEKVKTALQNLCVLNPPSTIGTPQYLLYTDASSTGIGAHLAEVVDGKQRPLGFFSATLPASGTSWSVEDRELYGIVKGLTTC